MKLVRDGRPVARIVPLRKPETPAERHARGRVIEQAIADEFGGPSLADIRRIYDSQGWDWPGNEAVHRTHTVADAS